MSSRPVGIALLVVRLAMGAAFVLAGAGKIGDPESFIRSVDAYHVVPALFVPLLGVVIPWIEVLSGGLLLLGAFSRAAALVQVGLLVAFSIGIAVNIARGSSMSCGCFDLLGFKEKVGYPVFFRDLVMLALALLLVGRGGGVWALDASLGLDPDSPPGEPPRA